LANPTVRLAVALFPVPPFAEPTGPLVFICVPAVGSVTFTVTEQDALVAIVPPTSEIEPEPAVAVTVPPQVVDTPFGVATTIPAGSVSVKPTPVSAVVEFGLERSKFSALVPPA
jgi:hypothetical protein